MTFVSSIQFEIWTIVWRRIIWQYSDVIKNQTQIYQGHMQTTYRISFWLNIWVLRYKVRKLTENYGKKIILRHCDFALWPTVIYFIRVRASVISNYLIKIASRSVHLFGWNFIHWQTDRQTDRQTHTTNCNENVTLPQFRGGVKKIHIDLVNENDFAR